MAAALRHGGTLDAIFNRVIRNWRQGKRMDTGR